jgi:RNA polymerase sigma factor (sigma-70 family)
VNSEQQGRQFEELVSRHEAILRHVVNAFANGADRDDLMQEVLLAVWKALPAFRGQAQLTTFLYRVSHNAAMTWRRGHQSYLRRVEKVSSNGLWRRCDPAQDPRTGQLERVYAAIRQFPPLDRSLLLLWLDEIGYRQMAEIHGLEESNVGVRLNRARTRLMEQLKGETDGCQ